MYKDGDDIWGVRCEEGDVEGIGNVRVMTMVEKEEAEMEDVQRKIMLTSKT